jgi:hypothetical protein
MLKTGETLACIKIAGHEALDETKLSQCHAGFLDGARRQKMRFWRDGKEVL